MLHIHTHRYIYIYPYISSSSPHFRKSLWFPSGILRGPQVAIDVTFVHQGKSRRSEMSRWFGTSRAGPSCPECPEVNLQKNCGKCMKMHGFPKWSTVNFPYLCWDTRGHSSDLWIVMDLLVVGATLRGIAVNSTLRAGRKLCRDNWFDNLASIHLAILFRACHPSACQQSYPGANLCCMGWCKHTCSYFQHLSKL